MTNASCKSCGAPIVWMVIESTKKPHPFNAKPINGWQPTGLMMKSAMVVSPGQYYVSHFATCPDAEKHRKKGG